MPRVALIALAGTLCLSSPVLFAATGSAASLSNFQVQLFDLDAGDGISPHYTLSSRGRTSLLGVASDARAGISQNHTVSRNGAFAPSELINSALPSALAQGHVTATELSVFGVANGENTHFSSNANTGSAANYPEPSGGLAISGRTLAVITMDAALAAAAWGAPSCGKPPEYCTNERATATARLGLSYNYNASNGSVSANLFDEFGLAASAKGPGDWKIIGWEGRHGQTPIYEYVDAAPVDQYKFEQRRLSVYFFNTSEFYQTANLYFSVGATGDGLARHVPYVPEPHTYALMLAGLGMMAWTARRHLR